MDDENFDEEASRIKNAIESVNPPDTNNIIVNESSLMQMLKRHGCRRCGSRDLEVQQHNFGLSTNIDILCRQCNPSGSSKHQHSCNMTRVINDIIDNPECHDKIAARMYKTSIRPAFIGHQYGRDRKGEKVNRKRMWNPMYHWDYTNCLSVIGLLSTGVSSEDFQFILTQTSIKTGFNFNKMYYSVAPMIGKAIHEVSEDVARENLIKEIELTFREKFTEMTEQEIFRKVELWRSNSPSRKKGCHRH
jgi:hypothetical protein